VPPAALPGAKLLKSLTNRSDLDHRFDDQRVRITT